MSSEIRTIRLPLPFGLGRVNCYLIHAEGNFTLVDTGGASNRKQLETELNTAGCQPGNLKLIILTHGDFDHTGNAAYLRGKYHARIAMHADDWDMLEHGNMFYNRKSGGVLMGKLVALFSRFGKSERCKPDISLVDGDVLTDYGFQGRVISIPGHSKGSIGILLEVGETSTGLEKVLLCGDLLDNMKEPGLSGIMDDVPSASASLERLKGLGIQTVYPGHGEPFEMAALNG
jgi:hydroxyacylglutathione hydrolase